jgi:hypothetical protein
MIQLRVDRIAAVMWQCAIAAVLAWQLSVPNASAKDPDSFVVHEWGTFSTFSGSDGKALKFYPNDTDLPAFVYNRHRNTKGGLTDAMVSLETPVLYFYTERDRTVSVRVDFPKGLMTDWYPEASRPPESTIRWDDLRVLANDKPKLLEDRGRPRYFAARETDSASLTTAGPEKRENEKFLFYRGVGDFQMPFEVRALGHGMFAVENTGKQAVPGHFLVSVQDRKVSFKSLGRLSPGAREKVELPAEASTAEKLGDAMTALLIEQGLFEKEARAMVKTWSRDWFAENGTRVLYLVAEPFTDELLPLKIDPKPDRLVRVLVGRHDVLTPEREVEIDAVVKRLHGDSNAESKAADANLNNTLGRYRSAAQAAAEKRLKATGVTRAGR